MLQFAVDLSAVSSYLDEVAHEGFYEKMGHSTEEWIKVEDAKKFPGDVFNGPHGADSPVELRAWCTTPARPCLTWAVDNSDRIQFINSFMTSFWFTLATVAATGLESRNSSCSSQLGICPCHPCPS